MLDKLEKSLIGFEGYMAVIRIDDVTPDILAVFTNVGLWVEILSPDTIGCMMRAFGCGPLTDNKIWPKGNVYLIAPGTPLNPIKNPPKKRLASP